MGEHRAQGSGLRAQGVWGLRPRFAMVVVAFCLVLTAGCGRRKPDSNTVTVLIESSPTNLDPRIGTDAQSEHIDPLIFDSLVKRNEHFGLDPWLAERWEEPNPTTIHLSPAYRRAVSGWAGTDIERREVDA